MTESTPTIETPDDITALGVFVDAAQTMTQLQLDAAVTYLNDRYGTHLVDAVMARLRSEFERLVVQSRLPIWTRHEIMAVLNHAIEESRR